MRRLFTIGTPHGPRRHGYARPMSQPAQQQDVPGIQSKMDPVPDCGEKSYQGSVKLEGKVAVITGGDSGIGRAVAIAYAREGAAVLTPSLPREGNAQEAAGSSERPGARRSWCPATC